MDETVDIEELKRKAKESAKFIPGAGVLMDMLVDRAIHIYGQLLELDKKTEVDHKIEKEINYTFIKTVDLIFKGVKNAVATEGLQRSFVAKVAAIIGDIEDEEVRDLVIGRLEALVSTDD